MIDDYGTTAALLMAHELFTKTDRRHGRTERMIAALKDGDVVIVAKYEVQKFIEGKCRERGLDIKVVVINPGNHTEYMPTAMMYAMNHNIHFDHTWVEEFWERRLNKVANELYDIMVGANRNADETSVSFRDRRFDFIPTNAQENFLQSMVYLKGPDRPMDVETTR